MIEFIFVPSRSNKQRKCVYSSGDFYAMVNHLEFRFFFIILNLILWLYRVRSITRLSSILKKNSNRIFDVTRSLNAASILNHFYPTCHCVGDLYTILATTMVVIIIIDVAVVVCFLRCLRSSVLCVHVFAVEILWLSHTTHAKPHTSTDPFEFSYTLFHCSVSFQWIEQLFVSWLKSVLFCIWTLMHTPATREFSSLRLLKT